MRIIGGVLARRILRFPKTYRIRPMTDRGKETIFNVLGRAAESAFVLDLFAGSGSLGIESLSRGAQHVYFVDSEKMAIRCITQNLEALGLESRAKVLKMPVARALDRLKRQHEKFDLVFSDPPYNKGLTKKTLRLLDRSDTLRPAGVVVAGYSNKESLPDDLKTLRPFRSIKIGQAFISFLVRRQNLERVIGKK